MIRDRGRIKWTSLFIPEHKALLAKMYQAESDVIKPILDIDKLTEFDEVISLSYHEHRPVRISYYENKRIKVIRGVITKIDSLQSKIFVSNENENLSVYFKMITDVINE